MKPLNYKQYLLCFVSVACGSFSGSFIEYFAHDMSKFLCMTFFNMTPHNENLSTPAAVFGPDDALYRLSSTTPGYPVRRKYPQAASERLTITSDTMMEALCDDHKEDRIGEQQEEAGRSSKRLLPDRSHAAHNRANEKLVHFIVKQRMVEGRLLV